MSEETKETVEEQAPVTFRCRKATTYTFMMTNSDSVIGRNGKTQITDGVPIRFVPQDADGLGLGCFTTNDPEEIAACRAKEKTSSVFDEVRVVPAQCAGTTDRIRCTETAIQGTMYCLSHTPMTDEEIAAVEAGNAEVMPAMPPVEIKDPEPDENTCIAISVSTGKRCKNKNTGNSKLCFSHHKSETVEAVL